MQLYKPNAKKTGHAVGFQFNSKDGALYIQFVKQTGWNDSTKKGSFQEGAKFNLKFNATEIGAILNCIERGRAEKLFHQAEKGSTSIQLDVFPAAPKDPAQVRGPRNGFTISVNPRANEGEEKPQTFGFWFNENEARLLKEYLQFVLGHFFSAQYSADKQKRLEYSRKKKAAAPESESEPAADGFGGEEDPL